MRRLVAMAAVAAMALTACAGDGASVETSTTVQIVTTTTTTPPVTSQFGRPLASALMNDLGGSMGAGDNTFVGDRFRVSNDLETEFVAALRETSATGEIPTDLDRVDDDELLYLGYFYCLALDAGLDSSTATEGVLASVLAERGAAGTEPTTDDIALALSTVNLSGGSLCGEYHDSTQAYLDGFRSS